LKLCIVVLDSVSKPIDFRFKRSRVTGTESASMRIFGLLSNPRRRAFTIGAGAIELAGARAPKFLTAGARGGITQIYMAPLKIIYGA